MDTCGATELGDVFEGTGRGLQGQGKDTEGTRSELEFPGKCLEDQGR